jgi:MFS family permease
VAPTIVLVIALLPSVVILPLAAWARWLRRRTAEARLAAWIAYGLLMLAALLTAVGAASSTYGVITAVATDSAGPSQKARVLAEGISAAMNCGALAIVVALGAVLWLLFASWRWHWSRRAGAQ